MGDGWRGGVGGDAERWYMVLLILKLLLQRRRRRQQQQQQQQQNGAAPELQKYQPQHYQTFVHLSKHDPLTTRTHTHHYSKHQQQHDGQGLGVLLLKDA